MGRLQDKTCIITGAGGGIGRASATRFLEEGANVLLVDYDEELLEETMREIDAGERAASAVADVSNADDVQRAVDTCIDTFGGLDVMFANAGTEGSFKPLVDLSEEEFDRVQQVNVKGCWLSLKYAVPHMRDAGGGSIIMTSSIAGLVGSPGAGAYAASKHGVIGLMQTAAQELGPEGIRVNTINPGPVNNRMMRSIEQQVGQENASAVKDQFSQMVPMGRYAENEEIADMAVFLASDESSFCNGTAYPIDGGFLSG
jgi:NAD(P)-dependent dehydrogenase (short-subunit alcohol dehydrogenase family)